MCFDDTTTATTTTNFEMKELDEYFKNCLYVSKAIDFCNDFDMTLVNEWQEQRVENGPIQY